MNNIHEAILEQLAVESNVTIEEYVAQQIKLVPPTFVEQFRAEGATDDADVVAKYTIYLQSNKDEQSTELQPKMEKGKVELHVNPALTDSEAELASKAIENDKQHRIAVTVSTKLKGLLVRAPKPSELFSDVELDFRNAEDLLKKMDAHRELLVDTEENRKNFDTLYNLVSTPNAKIKPRFNDQSRKYEGVVIETPNDDSKKGGMVTKYLSHKGLVQFLISETMGVIPSDPQTLLGARFKKVAVVANKSTGRGEIGKATPVIGFDGKADAIKNDRNLTVTCVPSGKKKTAALPVEISYKIYVKDGDKLKVNKKGQKVEKTVWQRGYSDNIPVLERSAQFVSVLGSLSNGTWVSAPQSPEELQEALTLLQDSVAMLGSSVMSDDMKKQIEELNKKREAANKQR